MAGHCSISVLVTYSNNVGLYSIICFVPGVSVHHDALIELALRTVGVVATCGKNDSALLMHWLVAGTVRGVPMSIASASNCAVWA